MGRQMSICRTILYLLPFIKRIMIILLSLPPYLYEPIFFFIFPPFLPFPFFLLHFGFLLLFSRSLRSCVNFATLTLITSNRIFFIKTTVLINCLFTITHTLDRSIKLTPEFTQLMILMFDSKVTHIFVFVFFPLLNFFSFLFLITPLPLFSLSL